MKTPITLVLLGDIAAGKDTQAEILARRYGLKLISTGVFTRKHWTRDKRFAVTKRGRLTPTKLIKIFLTKSIANTSRNRGLLINGGKMPSEARLIFRMLARQKREILVFYLTIPEPEIMKRLLVRRRMEKRHDDDPKAVKNRIAYYKKIYSRTVKFWRSRGLLRVVNGNKSISEVTKDILKILR